jgi:hemin uptake protein HemP
MTEPPRPPEPLPADKPAEPAPVVVAKDLFRGKREVLIEHDGVRYRLRITRRNKLILQK